MELSLPTAFSLTKLLYEKRMSADAAKELAKATHEKVKNEYELGQGHLNLEEEKNLRECSMNYTPRECRQKQQKK